jgi:hypothetical protein
MGDDVAWLLGRCKRTCDVVLGTIVRYNLRYMHVQGLHNQQGLHTRNLDIQRRTFKMKRHEMEKRLEIDLVAMEAVKTRENNVKEREKKVKNRKEAVRKREEDLRKREEDLRKREEDLRILKEDALLENAKKLQEERAKDVQSREIKVCRVHARISQSCTR